MVAAEAAGKRLRVVFFGLDTQYSRAVLRAIASAHDVQAVYSDRAPGRKRRGARTVLVETLVRFVKRTFPALVDSIRGLAATLSIPYSEVETVNADAVVREIAALAPDVICIASFNRLLKQPILSVPQIGTINAHAALLPDYRGPNVFFWMVKADERKGGVTLHWTSLEMDAGEILTRREIQLYPGLREVDYYRTLSILGAEAFHSTLASIALGSMPAASPNIASHTPVCRNPKLEDLTLEGLPTVEHALWFHAVASSYGTPAITAAGGEVKRVSRSPFPNARKVALRDGEIWCF